MHLTVQKSRNLGPRRRADRLDSLSAIAQHNPLMPIARDIDELIDPGRTVGLVFPLFGLDGQLIGRRVSFSRVISAAIIRIGKSAI
jgi:hypothetical protein